MVHALEHPHPDGKRIAGYSVAIAFNALLLMLILVPMQGPQGLRLATDAPPRIIWYTPDPPRPVVPPDVARPTPPAVPPERSQREVVIEDPPPVLVEDGALSPPAIEPVREAAIQPPKLATVQPPPLPGVRLEYLQAPPPEYPRASARMRSEGTVLLQVLVDVDGRPLQVEVRESSGDRRLDGAARDQVLQRWRFRPAVQDGRAVQALGLVPIEFKLR